MDLPQPLMRLYLELPSYAIGAALVLLVVGLAARNKRAKLRRLAYLLPGRVEGFFHPCFTGELEGGLPFRITLFPGSRSSVPRLEITVSSPCSFKLTVTREGALNSLGARLGLLKDIETPDPDFNRNYLLSGDQGGLAAGFLAEERHRLEIRELFGAGYENLAITPGGVKAIKPGYTDYEDLDPAGMADRVKRLAAIAKAARMY